MTIREAAALEATLLLSVAELKYGADWAWMKPLVVDVLSVCLDEVLSLSADAWFWNACELVREHRA